MKAAAFLFALLLIPLASAYWAETIQVKVISSAGYPVPDVPVEIKYQKQVTIEQYVAGETIVSNESGETAVDCTELPPEEPCPSPGDLGANSAVTYIVIEKTQIDMNKLDGSVQGTTNSEGIFETGLIDYVGVEVPSSHLADVRDYFIIVGSEVRRTSVGTNIVGTKIGRASCRERV